MILLHLLGHSRFPNDVREEAIVMPDYKVLNAREEPRAQRRARELEIRLGAPY